MLDLWITILKCIQLPDCLTGIDIKQKNNFWYSNLRVFSVSETAYVCRD